MSPREARVSVAGIEGAIRLRLHGANDRYISDELAAGEVWEPLETELVRRLVGSGDIFIDGGANIGWYSVVAGRANASVVAAEPMSKNLRLLRENIELNGVAGVVTVLPAALGARPGSANLQLSPDNQGDHRVSISPVGKTERVEITTIDVVCIGQTPRLVKLDTQGSEARILRGAWRTLSFEAATATALILEFWPYGLDDCGSSAEELIGLLSTYVPESHDCFEISEELGVLVPTTLSDLARMAREGDYSVEARGHMNLAVLPRSDLSVVADLVSERLREGGPPTSRGAFDLSAAERSVYSQFGEDGVIEDLALRTGCVHTFVEFGAGDGTECNSRYAREHGWRVAAFDGDPADEELVTKTFVTAENAAGLLATTGLADELGVLSIDVDGNDYWILRSLLEMSKPSIVVVEYNATLGPVEPLAVVYRAQRRWDHTNYFGASLQAYAVLGAQFGYSLVGCGREGVNAYFVRTDLLPRANLEAVPVPTAYRPPTYGIVGPLGAFAGHLPTTRRFERVGSAEDADSAYRAAMSPVGVRTMRRIVNRVRVSDIRRYGAAWLRNLLALIRHLPTR
jgi:FkbM family methyltransferase